ncbi:hypothetical protein PVK06_025585 [Gossypium arboreum]|uniref:Uncharacterized protein n=1 Tax=Gossypium arboreum TaxID=29729 RepID=A0ABR0PH90_GOSAR|nr:hypothetical protein PVK06_025585 [Gossypium arboreum]
MERLLEKDPFHLKCTLVHLAATIELENSNDLNLMACNLVKDYPQNKSTSLDGTFAPAWIGFRNAYVVREEGDQAMSAYRTAAHLFLGFLAYNYLFCLCFISIIFSKYLQKSLFPGIAFQFIMQAKAICPANPLVYNELGVVAYHMKEYNQAVWWFEKTSAIIPNPLSEMWEPTMVNLAHAYRKLKQSL